MTTSAEAHTTLSSAVGAADDIVSGPACIVFSNGSDLTALGGNQVEWGFRVLCYVGIKSDSQDATTALAALTYAKLVILRALAGWRIQSVSPDFTVTLAGGEHLAANIIVSTRVDLS